MKLGYATESRVRRMIKNLEESGDISESAYRENIEKRKNEEKQKNQTEAQIKQEAKLEDTIYTLIQKGATSKEMAYFLDMPLYLIQAKRSKVCKERNITSSDQYKYRQSRKLKFDDKKAKSKLGVEWGTNKLALQDFFKIEIDEVSYGHDLTGEELYILSSGIVQEEDLLSRDNLQLVISQHIKQNKFSELVELLKKLCMLYGDSKFGNELRQFRDFATEKLNEKLNHEKKIGPIL